MEPGERTGTTITYYASPDIFESTTYSLETITTRIREYAFLNKGLEIVVRDERPIAEEIVEAVQDDTATTPSTRPTRARSTAPRAVASSRSSSTTAAWSTTSSTSTGARTRRTRR